jgi:hypothetical protein
LALILVPVAPLRSWWSRSLQQESSRVDDDYCPTS